MSDENHYFGKDCPVGKVQVESVLGVQERRSEYGIGWKPSNSAMIDVYVDGRRFCISVGDFASADGVRRGLHITTDRLDLVVDKHSLNSVDLYFPAPVVQQGDGDADA